MNDIAKHSLLALTAISISAGLLSSPASALPGVKPKAATLADLTQSAGPDISQAELKVEQAKAQVDLAAKQVNASKALLKAAQADLKASVAQLDALKMNAKAQNLVEQAPGMTPAKAGPVQIADKGTISKEEETSNNMPASAPTPTPAPAQDGGRIKVESTETSEPIQLR